MNMKKVLFVCSKNKLRSKTAETIFANQPGMEVSSAGLDNDAINKLTPELVEWAEIIFVMENNHKNKLQKKFKYYLNKQRIICLNIKDEYNYMDPELIKIFKYMIPRLLS